MLMIKLIVLIMPRAMKMIALASYKGFSITPKLLSIRD